MRSPFSRLPRGFFKSYVAWLYFSFLCLALPTLVFAWVGWQLLLQSQYRVERGRIASDIYTALAEFDLEKARLRNWSNRRALAEGADPAERLAILAELVARAHVIDEKAAAAMAMDIAFEKPLAEREDRTALRDLLAAVIDKLTIETAPLINGLQPDLQALAAIDTELTHLADVPLADVLQEARAAEAARLARERERADQSLQAARRLFITAGMFGGIALLLMALLLARRLSQPLQYLRDGVQAYQDSGFTYRLGTFHDAEFSALAGQLNAMAAEVEQARAAAAERNIALEAKVAARTADLQAAVAQVSAAEAARKQLLADIGHELRTPVTVIRGEAQVALRGKTGDEALLRATLERIIIVTRQMAGLIEDLLTTVREAAPARPLQQQPVALAPLVDRALEAARGIGAQRGVTVVLQGTCPDLTLTTAPDHLRQVLMCLLDNAVRYSRDGGVVTLRPRLLGGQVVIAVIDTGIGISAEDMARIWGRSWRAPNARSHRADGLGLGLGIARKMAQDIGAVVSVTSDGAGRGTVASLSVPVRQE